MEVSMFKPENPKKKKLKSIAVKYICSRCGSPRFCVIDGEKTECISCTNGKCPDSKMYIFRQEEGMTLICCIADGLIEEINKSLRELKN